MKWFACSLRKILTAFQPGICESSPETALTAEQLEPRILYSAAPAPTDAPEPAGDPVPEASAEASTAAVPAPQAVPVPVEPVAVSAPEDVEGDSEISGEAAVELVDVGDAATSLNQEVVETLAAEALQRWIDSGISEEQIAALDSVSYDIADVGGAHLGVANGFTITIDDDAGGTGVGNWFIDATPGDDSEFDSGTSAATGRYDLLSTLIHEQGHVLGLVDVFADQSDVMDGLLDTGTRRLPVAGQATGAVAGSIVGDQFLEAHIVRASTDSSGAEGDGVSKNVSLSADGGFAVFESSATNLVAGDVNGKQDIFWKDLLTGETRLVSSNASGIQADDTSRNARISGDGRYVIFESQADNLRESAADSLTHIFRKDLVTGEILHVDKDENGVSGSGSSADASISADGRFVSFSSSADDLVDGDNNGSTDIFVKDLQTGGIVRASSTSAGVEGNNSSRLAQINADGRYVVFTSAANNLVDGDTNATWDVFRKDLKNGKIVRVSITSTGAEAHAGNEMSSISANGRWVAFTSDSAKFSENDTDGQRDVFVKDLKTGAVTKVSVAANGVEGTSVSVGGAISADGRFVAFSTGESLAPGDGNSALDIYLKDILTGSLARVSTDVNGIGGTGVSTRAAISADGRFVGFDSSQAALVDGDGNGVTDVFVKGVSSLTQSHTTSVEIDDLGNLVIEDIGDDDTRDRLFIGMVDGALEIRDKKNTVGSTMIASTSLDEHTIRIQPSQFTGDIIVDTKGGDDRVDIGDLSGLPGGIQIEYGTGHDILRQRGVVELTGMSSLEYRSEAIRLERNSAIHVVDGTVELLGNRFGRGTEKSVGVYANGSSVMASGSGTISIIGEGGVVGSGNRGVDLRNTEISTVNGASIFIDGTGGEGRSGNVGLTLRKGTNVSITGGTGNIDLKGDGQGVGSGNHGIRIDKGVTVSSAGGAIYIDGSGVAGPGSNYGLRVGKAVIVSGGSSGVELHGGAFGGGSRSKGVDLRGTVVQTENNGGILIDGGGGSSGSSSSSQGLVMKGVTLTAMGGGDIELVGKGRGDRSSVLGIRVAGSTLESAGGAISIRGESLAVMARNGNVGISMVGSTLGAAEDIEFRAQGGQGQSNNSALVIRSTEMEAGGEVDFAGNRSISGSIPLSSGNNNRGVDLNRVGITAASVEIEGYDSGGKHNNEGVRIRGGQIMTTSGDVVIAGYSLSGASHSGNANGGANLSRLVIESSGSIEIGGVGGEGKNRNMGVRILGSTLNANGGKVDIDGNVDRDTIGKDNNGVQLIKSDVTAQGNVEIDGRSGGGTDRNVGIDVRGGSITSEIRTVNIAGVAKDETTGSRNGGVQITGAMIQALASDIFVNGGGGGGLNDNRGLSIIGSTLSANDGAGLIDLFGDARTGTAGKGNTGIYLINRVTLDGVVMIEGEGGGGIGLNHGIYVHRTIVADNVAVVNGTAGAGDGSEDETGDFFAIT